MYTIFWKSNISYPLIRTDVSAYQGVRNVSFSMVPNSYIIFLHIGYYYPSTYLLVQRQQRRHFGVLIVNFKNIPHLFLLFLLLILNKK